MHYPYPLEPGVLVRRYQRFLADITLADGRTITAHCPNTGSMQNCASPGSRVWVYDAHNPRRKLRYSWELVEVAQRYLACINTQRANQVIKEGVISGHIPELAGYAQLRSECRYGRENSRIDFLLQDEEKADCYVEVKNVTLLEHNGLGRFPDAVTTRGSKHLRELMAIKAQGKRAVLVFNVAHTGIERLCANHDIDPDYAANLHLAAEKGVEIIAYANQIDLTGITVGRALTVLL